jgi:hypothetical protein
MLSRLLQARVAQVLLEVEERVQHVQTLPVLALQLVGLAVLVATRAERHQPSLELEPSTLVVLGAEDFWVLEAMGQRARQVR